MARAMLCVPYDLPDSAITCVSAPIGATQIQFTNNDEPGLVFSTTTSAGAGIIRVIIDLGIARPVQFVSLLGCSTNGTPLTLGLEAGPTNVLAEATYSPGSTNLKFGGASSAEDGTFKSLHTFPPGASHRFWFLRIATTPGATITISRVLIGTVIQPGENLSIGAEEGVDDRSVRRYVRNGRRTIDPTRICPTLQAEWPWLTQAEFVAMRTWWRRRGATKPSMIVLDPDPATGSELYGGEDGIFYGDFEKSAKFGYEDGCWSFGFAMVSEF